MVLLGRRCTRGRMAQVTCLVGNTVKWWVGKARGEAHSRPCGPSDCKPGNPWGYRCLYWLPALEQRTLARSGGRLYSMVPWSLWGACRQLRRGCRRDNTERGAVSFTKPKDRHKRHGG